jgi:two-component system LytT family response regulator
MTTELQALIVDDERAARERIVDLVAPRDDVEVVGLRKSGTEAIEAIREKQPDLVFLDVQMPEVDGLEVVDQIGPTAMPVTIFVTAYDRYALDAFEAHALDYLLKPYDDERFKEAIERAQEQIRLQTGQELSQKMENLLEETRSSEASPADEDEDYLERIAVERRDRVLVVSVDELWYVTADGPYLKLHVDEDTHLIRERMKTLERQLDPRQFIRIHRSTLVNLERVDALVPKARGGYEVELEDDTRLKVSRSRKETLEERIGIISS